MKTRIFACFLATFVANGLARFGYVVLIPIMIISGRFTQTESYQLGIAILVGYIFGSVLVDVLKSYLSLEMIAKMSFLLISLSFFACMVESFPFIWAWFWRFVAGVASSALMILAAPLSLPFVNERHKGKIGGFVFAGIGIGAVASGFVLPSIARHSIDSVWVVLGGIALIACAFSFYVLPVLNPAKKTSSNQTDKFKIPFFLWLLIASYVLNAVGYLGHTLFWVDYLVRDLHFSTAIAGISWAFFGIGAAFGSLGSGFLSDKIGLKNAHLIVLGLKALSCFIAAYCIDLTWLNISIFLMGFTTTGNVTLTNAMALHICGKNHFTTSSSKLTFAFGIFQAIFSYLFAYWITFLQGYFWLFMICGTVLIVSALIILPITEQKILQTS
ncbi:YbfB/YjiJ family MFS transporter [Helicobacter sp. 13S00477-4]|uniref:YbfB/YjiJ family MFS transporter n=1 Tax=Helicobacter sp. 13S00477-4 TaxID=1905759 RepID=UPI000BA63DE8|nr:YbfB/YjiJ family MFS transporter [Helicobacter sp. 13S00477-4]PAF50623.1 MFS transporter [Helicobacter sp. 13S00477-4]